jgi:DNA-binding NarL/FixJ family response regulator
MDLRCLIVDDSPEFLDAVCRLLEQEGVDVAGVASTGDDAVRLADELRPDVTLVDIDLGGEDGFAVARRLAAADSNAGNVVMISTHTEDEFAELIDASVAVGFISKQALSRAAI